MPTAKTRDYTPKELDWEYEVEYLKYSRPSFPIAFASRGEFQAAFDAAPLVTLVDDDLRNVRNSMAYLAKGRNETWLQGTFSHRRDVDRIVRDLREGETAPPILLRDENGLWLMAGQTRLACGLALGIDVPVKVIQLDVFGKADNRPTVDVTLVGFVLNEQCGSFVKS